MEFTTVVESVFVLFVLMGVGYLAYKKGIIDTQGSKSLSSVLINITLPCLIITAMQVPLTAKMLENTVELFIIIGVFYAVSCAVALIIPRFLTKDKSEKGVYQFMLVFSNLGFMGIPVTAAMFGEGAIFYTSLFMLVFNLLVFTIGILMLRPDLRDNFNLRLLINPGIIAAILGLIFFFTEFRIPSPIGDSLELLGSATVPLAMLVTGSILAAMPFKEMFTDLRIYVISACRLLLLPLIMYLIVTPFIEDPILRAIPVLLAAMPVATNTVVFTQVYGADSSAASKGVFISTVFCLITLPILAMFLM